MLLQAYEQHALAVAYLARAGSIDTEDLRWAYYLGTSLSKLGRHAEAASSFRRCTDIDDSFVPAQRRFAEALLESGEADAALMAYRRLADKSPGDPQGPVRAGSCGGDSRQCGIRA